MTTILAFVFFLARSHDLERSIDHLIRGASGTTPQVPGEGKKDSRNYIHESKEGWFCAA